MKEAMINCELGDDVFEDDPTVNHMQNYMAEFFGKEKAILLPSGTQSNLCSLLVNVPLKGSAAIIGNRSHIYNYERGGIAALGNICPLVIENLQDGTFDLEVLEKMIPIQNVHLPQPSVICLENSQGGTNGAAIPLDFVKNVKKIAKKNKLKMHLDGARLLNALIYSKDDPIEYCSQFDTVNFCFSKGMGCPIGSLLLGSEQDIKLAKVMRKMLGGTMRQAGILAACMLTSMEDWREKLTIDNENCYWLANQLNENVKGVSVNMKTVQTNMFSFVIDSQITQKQKSKKGVDHVNFAQILKEEFNILTMASFKNDSIRVVTHRDVNRDDLEYTKLSIDNILRRFL